MDRAYFERWRGITLEVLGWKKCWEMPNEYISSGDRKGGVEVITIYKRDPASIIKQIAKILEKRDEYRVVNNPVDKAKPNG